MQGQVSDCLLSLFLFTVDVLITKLKKFFKNIDPKISARYLILECIDVLILGLNNVNY